MKIDNLREKHRKEALMWKAKMKEVARDNQFLQEQVKDLKK